MQARFVPRVAMYGVDEFTTSVNGARNTDTEFSRVLRHTYCTYIVLCVQK